MDFELGFVLALVFCHHSRPLSDFLGVPRAAVLLSGPRFEVLVPGSTVAQWQPHLSRV